MLNMEAVYNSDTHGFTGTWSPSCPSRCRNQWVHGITPNQLGAYNGEHVRVEAFNPRRKKTLSCHVPGYPTFGWELEWTMYNDRKMTGTYRDVIYSASIGPMAYE